MSIYENKHICRLAPKEKNEEKNVKAQAHGHTHTWKTVCM